MASTSVAAASIVPLSPPATEVAAAAAAAVAAAAARTASGTCSVRRGDARRPSQTARKTIRAMKARPHSVAVMAIFQASKLELEPPEDAVTELLLLLPPGGGAVEAAARGAARAARDRQRETPPTHRRSAKPGDVKGVLRRGDIDSHAVQDGGEVGRGPDEDDVA